MASPEQNATMPATKHRNRWLTAVILAIVAVAAAGVIRLRGPVLPGYEVLAGPLVQNVVATGRVAAQSRVQVGPEITGLVLERRVMDGDRVVPGDLLVVFADELARSWKQIIYFKKAEREAIITAKPPRVERPAAEFEELVSATDLLIRDERGVRLARAEPEGAD